VTKKEIVKTISDETGLNQQQIKAIVQKTFDSIIKTLQEEGRIELRNFGVFQVRTRAARKARNPRTGRQVEVPEKFVVTFKPGKIMEQQVATIEGTPLAQTIREDIASGKIAAIDADFDGSESESAE
jgi:nucleoid DNA-binding protein